MPRAEGVNLQRGHLMVNYDLPWNPNKIEQRFGRIHRIGQTEVCHLWNLVAADTREGEVYARLLEKLEAAREALGGRVYDVLGELFEGTALKDLLFEAIQYGEREEVKARLFQQVDGAIDQEHLLELSPAPRADKRHHARGPGRGTSASKWNAPRRNGSSPAMCRASLSKPSSISAVG